MMEDPHASPTKLRSAMMPLRVVVMTVSVSVLMTVVLIALLVDKAHRSGYAEGLLKRQQVQVETSVLVVGDAVRAMECFTGCPNGVDR